MCHRNLIKYWEDSLITIQQIINVSLLSSLLLLLSTGIHWIQVQTNPTQETKSAWKYTVRSQKKLGKPEGVTNNRLATPTKLWRNHSIKTLDVLCLSGAAQLAKNQQRTWRYWRQCRYCASLTFTCGNVHWCDIHSTLVWWLVHFY